MGWDSFDIRGADDWTTLGTRILGEMVLNRRRALRWSQRELARYVGCDQSVISRLERGLIRGMRYRKFARLVAVMGGLEPDAPEPTWFKDDRGPNPYLATLAAFAAADRAAGKAPADRAIASAADEAPIGRAATETTGR